MSAIATRPTAVEIGLSTALPVALGALFPFAMHFAVGPGVGPYWANILLVMGINVILAVSLNIVNGYTGQFSIGHAGFMAIGGYVSATVTWYGGYALFGVTTRVGGMFGQGELLFVAGALLGALAAAAFGFVVGLPSLRLKGDYLAIVTLGFGEIVRVMFTLTEPKLSATKLANVEFPEQLGHLGGAVGMSPLTSYTSLFWVWAFVALTVLVAWRLKESSHGRAFLSVREDEIAAEAMGIDTTSVKVRAFVIAAAFAGIAGALYAHQLGSSLSPKELGFQKSFEVVIMVVLGGMGSVSGAVLAAMLLTVLPELLREFSEYRMIVYALTLIVMMLVRPQGLFGIHEAWELPMFRAKPKAKKG